MLKICAHSLFAQRIGPQKMDDGKIEIVGFWAATFVS